MKLSDRIHAALPILVGCVLIAPFCFAAVSETDAGWHLALGRLMAQGEFPRVNALAWTQPDHHFYATSWLFDLACYVFVDVLGIAGLQWLVFLFMVLTIAFMAASAREVGGSAWWCVPIALMLTDRIVARPHLPSWALLAVCTFLCLRSRNEGDWRLRAAVVPLIALGSNLHAGAIFSSAVLGLFCVVTAAQERAFVREGAIAAAGVLALMCNPGGTYNVFYAVRHLSMYETLQLTEFAAPSLQSGGAWFAMAPLAVGLSVPLWRKRPALVLSVIVFAAAGFFAVRLAFKFLILAAPLLAAGWPLLQSRVGARPVRLLAVLVGVVALAVNVGPVMRLRVGPRWDHQEIPVRAVAFAKSAGLDGRVWNGFTDGGYLEWALPEVPAFQDARVLAYDAEFFHRQQEAERSPEAFMRYLREMDVEWVLTTNVPGGLTGNGLVRHGDEWALVYWDELNEVYVRRDVVRLRPITDEHDYQYMVPTATPASLVSSAQTLPPDALAGFRAEVERFLSTSPGNPWGELARCAIYSRLREPQADSVCDAAADVAFSEDARRLVSSARSPPGA